MPSVQSPRVPVVHPAEEDRTDRSLGFPGLHDRLWVLRYALPTSLVGMHLVHRMNTLPARLGYSGGFCEALLGVSRVCQPEERSVTGTYDLRDRYFGQPMSIVIGPAKNLTHRA